MTDGVDDDDWVSAGNPKPLYYHDSNSSPTLPQETIQVSPAPSDTGELQVLYTALGDTLANTGVELSIPPDFAPIIKWEVLYLMLSKVGRAHDGRSAYCHRRYQEGVAATKLLLSGYS